MSQNITIDDQDLSRVKYTGSWVRAGDANEYDNTVASSTVVGDSFTVSFQGTSISAYGTIDASSGGSQTNYSIDGAPHTTVTSQAGSGDMFHQLFWKSPALAFGPHTLTVVVAKVNPSVEPGEGTVWFDYFVVTDPNTEPPGKKANKGAIADGIIGGVLLLALCLFCFLFVWRRRRKNTSPQPIDWQKVEDHDLDDTYTTPQALETRTVSQSHLYIEPFVDAPADDVPLRKGLSPNPPRENAMSTLPSTTNAGLSFIPATSSSPLSRPDNTSTGQDHPPPTSSKLAAPAHLSHPPSSASIEEEAPIQHSDSGIRNITPELATVRPRVELPPAYSPA